MIPEQRTLRVSTIQRRERNYHKFTGVDDFVSVEFIDGLFLRMLLLWRNWKSGWRRSW